MTRLNRKTTRLSPTVAVSIFFFFSMVVSLRCHKTNSTATGNTLTAKVNGTATNLPQITIVKDTIGATLDVEIIGTTANGDPTIVIIIAYNLIGPTATIDLTKKDFAIVKYLTLQDQYMAYFYTTGSSGTVSVTRNDTTARRLEGTYNCTAALISGSSVQTTQLLEGNFAVSY